MRRFFVLVLSLASLAAAASEPDSDQGTLLQMAYKTEDHSSSGSTGSSQGKSALLERKIGRNALGVEYEYDLPSSATAQERERQWQLPARILKLPDGSLQLLNAPALEARLDLWLAKAKWSRDVCGQWIFTWNAFKIDCDPQSILATVAGFKVNLPNIKAGSLFAEKGTLQAMPLRQAERSERGPALTVTLQLDPEDLRRQAAQTNVAVSQITGKPVTYDIAIAAQNKKAFSGTITVTFDMDESDQVWKTTRESIVRTEEPDGSWSEHRAEEVVERKKAFSIAE